MLSFTDVKPRKRSQRAKPWTETYCAACSIKFCSPATATCFALRKATKRHIIAQPRRTRLTPSSLTLGVIRECSSIWRSATTSTSTSRLCFAWPHRWAPPSSTFHVAAAPFCLSARCPACARATRLGAKASTSRWPASPPCCSGCSTATRCRLSGPRSCSWTRSASTRRTCARRRRASALSTSSSTAHARWWCSSPPPVSLVRRP